VRIVAIRDWDAPKAQNKSEKEKKACRFIAEWL